MADKNKIRILLTAIDSGLSAVFSKANKTVEAAKQGAESYGKSMDMLKAPIRAVTGTLAQLGAAFGAVFATKKFLAVAEAYTGIDARLRLVTESSEELAAVQDKLYQLSQKTGTGYQENAATYTKLATALKASGAGSDELIRINEAVSKSLVVAGASASEASSFLLQFGQAMGSGVLQGDELRAMLESNSYFAQKLAEALETDIAGLREMGSAGELTTAKIREAIPKMLQQINDDFAKMPLNIGRVAVMLYNAFGKIVNGSNSASGATGKIANAIKNFVTYLDANGKQVENFVVNMIEFAGSIAKAAWEYKTFIAGFAATTLAVSALASLTTAVKGLSAAFLFIGRGGALLTGVVGAAIFAGVAIGNLIARYFALRDATQELAQAQRDAKAQSDWIDPKVAAKLGEINSALRTNFRTMDELFAAEKRGEISFNSMTQTWVRGAKEQANAVSASAAVQKKVSGEALEAMKKKYQSYAAEIKRLQDDIAGREKSLYDQLREMARTGMSDVNAWEDLKRQADEYAYAAKVAAESGNFDFALDSADRAKELYSQLNTEVREGDKVLVSQADALKTAMDGVKNAGELGIQALKGQQAAAKDAMNALTGDSGFQNLREGMDETEVAWLENWQRMQAAAIKDIEKVEDRLKAIKDREVTVWINEKVKKAMGGMIGTAQRFSRGGKLSGYGGGDRISALLEAGEFIIRKEAVARFGSDFFYRLNSLQFPDFSAFANGGLAGAAGSGSQPLGSTYNLTLNYSGSATRTDANTLAKQVMAELQRMHRRAS